MEQFCDFGLCKNTLNLRRMPCKHNLCRDCVAKSKASTNYSCIACEEDRINKILMPFMYKLYDWHAIYSGVTNKELLFGKNMETPAFTQENVEHMLEMGWRVTNQKRLEQFMDKWESI